MSEQTNGKRINVERLVKEVQKIRQDIMIMAKREGFTVVPSTVQMEVPDVLTLVRAIDPTLLKEVWSGNIYKDNFKIFASFGTPESDQWLVTLVAKEK